MMKKISSEKLLEISKDSNIVDFKSLEELFGITQKYLYGRLYVNKDIIPQSTLDELRHFYKTLAKNSGVGINPYKKQKSSPVTVTSVWVDENRNEASIESLSVSDSVYSAIDVEEDEYEDRIVGENVRDFNGKIKEYKYRILVRDKDPIEGTLTLNQMQTLYFQYSNEGAKLSTRKVLESFPQFNINELKKVLRAFNITKDCKPFAPHFVESHTEEELKELLLQYSVDRVAKSANKDEIKYKNGIISDQAKEIDKLKQERENIKSWFKDINIPSIIDTYNMPKKAITNKSLILYPSDWHIGCYLNPNSTFYHPYDIEEIKNRIYKSVNTFSDQFFDEIIIANLGDTIDGFGGQTTRGGHVLPQIPEGDKQIYNWFIEAMTYLFDLIHNNIGFNKIRYYSVGESNHGGTGEWLCQKSLENLLLKRYPKVEVHISDQVYDIFKVYNEHFIISHGN